jgi:predicted nucleotide-binding protein
VEQQHQTHGGKMGRDALGSVRKALDRLVEEKEIVRLKVLGYYSLPKEGSAVQPMKQLSDPPVIVPPAADDWVPAPGGKATRHERKKAHLVCIGHGRSPLWRELKDFLVERVHLRVDEFNRVPIAGLSTTERLAEMLESAVFAFLIMTGEDEQADGKLHSRLNVVHEAGLFQGRLGFKKAIILLEDGCEEFSNIYGLGQIRFPIGNISAQFEAIRRVLEREIVISAGRRPR